MAQHICKCTNVLLIRRTPETLTSQFVRWRKPIWVPKAKSKIYKVPVRPEPNEEERAVMLKFIHHYNTRIKSLRRYLFNYERQHDARSKLGLLTHEELEAEAWDVITTKNDKWNSQVAQLRKMDLEQIQETLSKKDVAIRDRDMREKEEQVKEARARLVTELAAAEDFIKEDDLEDKIEELLNTRADYNFAINTHGDHIKKNKTSFDT